MALRATIVDPLVDEVPAEWDETVAALGLSPLWRASIITKLAWCSVHRPLLSLVADGAGNGAAVFSARQVGMGATRRRFADPQARHCGFLQCSMLPGVSQAGHAFGPDLQRAEQIAAIATFEQAVKHRFGWRCRGIVYRQVGEQDVEAFDGRLVRRVRPEFAIENRWSSFDAYLAALPASERREIERVNRRITLDAGITTGIEHRIGAGDASRLLFKVLRRHQPRLRAAPFPAVLCAALGSVDSARFLTFRDAEGRLQALGVLVDEGTALRWHSWGAHDRRDGGLSNLYFHCLAELMRELITSGAERLLLGKASEALAKVKTRFGGQHVPLYAAARLC